MTPSCVSRRPAVHRDGVQVLPGRGRLERVGREARRVETRRPHTRVAHLARQFPQRLVHAQAVRPPDHVVQQLLDDDGDDVEQRVHAAHTDDGDNEISHAVPLSSDIELVRPYPGHHVPETDRRERHERVVERAHIVPALHVEVERRAQLQHQARAHQQVEQHPVHRGLPLGGRGGLRAAAVGAGQP